MILVFQLVQQISSEDFILNQPLASPSLWNPAVSMGQPQTPASKPGAFEIKFLIEESLLEPLISTLATKMQADPHADPKTGGYSVEGIYFETQDRDVFRRIPGYSRRKFRIRRYAGGPNIFLERKSKRKGIVTKRRVQIESSELDKILAGTYKVPLDGLQEAGPSYETHKPPTIDWFTKRIDKLKLHPTLCIAYDRVAFLQMDQQSPIRLTIDRGMRCCSLTDKQFPSQLAYRPFLGEKCVVEMKYRDAMPNAFREILEEFKLVSQPVSKFRNAIVVAGLAAPIESPSAEGT